MRTWDKLRACCKICQREQYQEHMPRAVDETKGADKDIAQTLFIEHGCLLPVVYAKHVEDIGSQNRAAQ